MNKFYIAAVAVTLGLLAGTAQAQGASVYKLGDVIPETLTLNDQNGKTHKMGDFRGKPVVLEWTNSGCPFVQKHYSSGNMQKLQEVYTGKGVTWLSVISSAPGKQGYLEPKTAAAEVSKTGFKGTAVVLDPKGTLGKAFGAETTPHMYVLDGSGKLVYMGAIDSIPSFNKDDIAKAENYTAKAVDAVLAGQPVATAQTKSYGCSVKY